MTTATLEPITTAAAPAVPEPTTLAMASVRGAQQRWAATPLRDRLRVLRKLRHAIAADAVALAGSIPSPNRTIGEKIVSEVLPLADALRFLERYAARALRPVRWGAASRPAWLWGVRLRVLREPLGVVLIVSPSNYPLLLPGVQAVQALAAGNAVVIKPAPGCSAVAYRLATLAEAAGLSADLLTVLPETTQAVTDTLDAGVDKVLFTGSSSAGQAVLRAAAEHGVPATVELSGNDAVFLCDDADLEMAAKAVAFGMRFNGSATCVAPGRVFVASKQLDRFVELLAKENAAAPSLHVAASTVLQLRASIEEVLEVGGRVVCGGIDSADAVRPIVAVQPAVFTRLLREGVFGPVVAIVAVSGMDEALRLDADCPHHLGASVFGGAEAQRLAGRIDAGVVVINDVLAPHADPRLPFGGRGASGFGVTRGLEGLLELTQVKAVSTRRGTARPHYAPLAATQDGLFVGLLQLRHGRGIKHKLAGLASMVRGGRKSK